MFDNNFFLIATLTLIGIFLIEYYHEINKIPKCPFKTRDQIENPLDQRFAVLEEKLDQIMDKLEKLDVLESTQE